MAKCYSFSHKDEAVKKLNKRARKGDVSIYSLPVEAFEVEKTSDCEMPSSKKVAKFDSPTSSEITPTSTNVDSEQNGCEEPNQAIGAAKQNGTTLEQMATPNNTTGEKDEVSQGASTMN